MLSEWHARVPRAVVWITITFVVGFTAPSAWTAPIPVGGDSGWQPPLGTGFQELTAHVGDQLAFVWTPGKQNVVALRQHSCLDVAGGVELAGADEGQATVPLRHSGVFHFASSVPGQCEENMLQKVVVVPENMTKDEFVEGRLADEQHRFEDMVEHGTGHCLEPAQDPADAAVYTAVCYSPGILLRPGQVVNKFYSMPNPYPEGRVVALLKQTSNIVDAAGRPVPLSEAYLHHTFGSRDFIRGEGAEYRGGWATEPAQFPYVNLVNGSKFASDESRLTNLHIISTWGVAPEDVQKCVECWCSDERSRLEGRHGGGHCCNQTLCPSTVATTASRTYYVQYNVTYREVTGQETVQPTIMYMMDGVNGTIEYDVVKGAGTNATSALSLTGPIDARCPQAAPFSLLRCLGHLHIGGTAIELRDEATGKLLCSSVARYGGGAREAVGDEQGFLVAMPEDVKAAPLQIAPGTRVTMRAEYNASAPHYGVMALWFLTLVGFDESCPGPRPAAGPVFGPSYADQEYTAFGIFFGGLSPGRGSSAGMDPGCVAVHPSSSALLPPNCVAGGSRESAGEAVPHARVLPYVLLAAVVVVAAVCLASLVVFVWRTQQARRSLYNLVPQSEQQAQASPLQLTQEQQA